ncbi:hypothetical protein HR060_02245 [Catenovulum sp. SM1970]|uniref:hypothetical protein n=1 Tax=Marinifaba aquimaris TaxID=2741323 RepID=UPI001573B771|nr:hypothetical protein [Marinifaba aquimaris]NTS75676.1 hypothetical protein [Marinifaba aquimaris]
MLTALLFCKGSKDKLIGLRVSYQINDDLNIMTNLKVAGRDDFELNVAQLYTNYVASSHLSVQLGRVSISIARYADISDIGYTHNKLKLNLNLLRVIISVRLIATDYRRGS